jgi:hypothetical protein
MTTKEVNTDVSDGDYEDEPPYSPTGVVESSSAAQKLQLEAGFEAEARGESSTTIPGAASLKKPLLSSVVVTWGDIIREMLCSRVRGAKCSFL